MLAPPAPSSRLSRAWILTMVALIVAAFAIRACYFGNPIIDDDEEFYLLVGDRLLHGVLPYVDLWDRKPLGLFVLFAGIRLLGGDGVLAYQLAAASCVAATAILIAAMARRVAGPGAALVAGLAYIPALGLLGGQGGQTPVFYNLPMAAAAWLIFARITGVEGALRTRGAAAMLLVGIAMQLKYNAVFEGVYFGCALLWMGRREGRALPTMAIDAAVWIAAALVPTLIGLVWYAAIGQLQAFAYANFGSIFSREGLSRAEALHNLGHDIVRLLPFLIVLPLAVRDTAQGYRFLLGWLGAAVIGFLLFGTYFNHYTLPLLPPLAVAVAPAFRRSRLGPAVAALILLALLVWYAIAAHKETQKRGTAAYGYDFARRIDPLLAKGGCLFIFYGAPIYYHLSHSCLPTRWPFPYHLSLRREAAAIGVDPVAEMRHILASRPAAVIDKVTTDPEVNLQVQALLRDELARHYTLVYQHSFPGGLHETDRLWARR